MDIISIIIPSHNRHDLLGKCIFSILKQRNACYEIIIVDNGSCEKFVPIVASPQIRYIRLDRNEGFSKAVNIGIKEAKGKYIAILNNDTELDNCWIDNIFKAFAENPDILFITSKIIRYNNREMIDDVGNIILPYGKVYKIGYNERDNGQYKKARVVFGASGAASAFRREFFEIVGFFDEDFFAYLEDIDLSFRANLLGLKCLYVPDAVVYHIGSATTGSTYNKFTVYYLGRNTFNVIVKNFPARLILLNFFKILAFFCALQLFFFIKGLGGCYFRGIISAAGMLKRMIEKRKYIMKNRIISDIELIRILQDNYKIYRLSKSNKE